MTLKRKGKKCLEFFENPKYIFNKTNIVFQNCLQENAGKNNIDRDFL